MSAVLDPSTVDAWLADHDRWRRDGDRLVRTVECASFPAAVGLVDAVAQVAEQRDHHPDIDIRWRTLHFGLSTHSAGGITDKDLALAEAIDGLAPPGGQ